MRNECYNNQKQLVKLGLAPEAYKKFDIKNPIYKDNKNAMPICYCYITEIVEVIHDYNNIDFLEAEKIGRLANEIMDCSDLWINEEPDNDDSNKFVPYAPNWGYKNGKLVIIDCEG